ncbi:MAG: FMN-binding protein [Clostridia bacterium]|nr:FMN-binding protein [Clostridia bacterium]
MEKKTKIVLTVIAAVLLLALIAGGFYLKSVAEYKAKVEAITFTSPDLAQLPDGTYEGSFDAGIVAARVHVFIEDHTIVRIDILEHKNGKGKPAEAVIANMVGGQTTAVEAVAGATNSSKVLRKAVENALEAGPVR